LRVHTVCRGHRHGLLVPHQQRSIPAVAAACPSSSQVTDLTYGCSARTQQEFRRGCDGHRRPRRPCCRRPGLRSGRM
jgi:hypothetical protein